MSPPFSALILVFPHRAVFAYLETVYVCHTMMPVSDSRMTCGLSALYVQIWPMVMNPDLCLLTQKHKRGGEVTAWQ